MFQHPGPQSGGDYGCVFRFIRKGEMFLVFERGFYVLEKGNREAVALVEVGQVDGEAAFLGVVVG